MQTLVGPGVKVRHPKKNPPSLTGLSHWLPGKDGLHNQGCSGNRSLEKYRRQVSEPESRQDYSHVHYQKA